MISNYLEEKIIEERNKLNDPNVSEFDKAKAKMFLHAQDSNYRIQPEEINGIFECFKQYIEQRLLAIYNKNPNIFSNESINDLSIEEEQAIRDNIEKINDPYELEEEKIESKIKLHNSKYNYKMPIYEVDNAITYIKSKLEKLNPSIMVESIMIGNLESKLQDLKNIKLEYDSNYNEMNIVINDIKARLETISGENIEADPDVDLDKMLIEMVLQYLIDLRNIKCDYDSNYDEINRLINNTNEKPNSWQEKVKEQESVKQRDIPHDANGQIDLESLISRLDDRIRSLEAEEQLDNESNN